MKPAVPHPQLKFKGRDPEILEVWEKRLDAKPALRSMPCLHKLLGHRCRGIGCLEPANWPGEAHTAWSGTFDHCLIWKRGRKVVAFTSEPYGISGDNLFYLVTWANQQGLHITIDAYSPWYPQATLMIVLQRKEQKGRLKGISS